jgi:hypothetical protein
MFIIITLKGDNYEHGILSAMNDPDQIAACHSSNEGSSVTKMTQMSRGSTVKK